MPPFYYRKIFLSPSLAAIYDLWVFIAVLGRTKQLRNNILRHIPKKAKVILDLATGTGENALAISKHFPAATILASDLSSSMLAVAKKKSRTIHFSIQDATKTKYKSGIADFVSITFALHDLPLLQRSKVIGEAYRLLKKGGIFAIYDYHQPKWLMVAPLWLQFLLAEDKNAHSILTQDLQADLEKAGFKKTAKELHYGSSAQIVTGKKL